MVNLQQNLPKINKKKEMSKNMKIVGATLVIFALLFLAYTFLTKEVEQIVESDDKEDIIKEQPNIINQKDQPLMKVEMKDGHFYGPVSRFSQIVDQFGEWKQVYDNSPVIDDGGKLSSSPDIDILLFLSTWCPMARASVPPFMKTMEKVGPSNIKVTMIALDRSKTDPGNLAQKYGVSRVPTFVVLKEGKEIARFVEIPKKGNFVHDLVAIL